MLHHAKKLAKKMVPKKAYKLLLHFYHYGFSLLGAVIYRFPTRHIKIVGVTGTKGKTSTIEIINSILEEAGYKTAVAGTLHFKIGGKDERNMYKMTMPGRLTLQRFFRRAVNDGCDWAVVEMTSQGVLQHRHRFIALDTLVFTNISPEHIESHGSFKNYLNAKLKLVRSLESSSKKNKAIIANADDEYGYKFLEGRGTRKFPFHLQDAEPYKLTSSGVTFTFRGEEIHSNLQGRFNIYNALAGAVFGESQGIGLDTIKNGIENLKEIRGRLEKIDEGQSFSVYVDYAHTPDSLEKVYEVFAEQDKVCVLGGTGGGRDKWKRKEMAKIAENHCSQIILTNEDPYDEDPQKIVDEMARAITIPKYQIIMDRRKAIRSALEYAKEDDVILITGKGTDPYIMGPRGSKISWDDARVVREELKLLLEKEN